MTQKTRNIIGWVLTGLLAFVFLSSATMKLIGGEEAVKGAAAMGLSAATVKLLGMVEIISIVLFIVPRTGLLGTLLLAAYLGGAIATHVEHQQAAMVPIILQVVLWITAVVRFNELSKRLVSDHVIAYDNHLIKK
ncbi:DoxX family protein [Ferruginibacter lapsinanis]|uniref:DoxX family protein n=1 Tax=Ferruginibacter lapsinanis TaxID=563172 RepID=UPI001E2D7A2C|nr:DoxX family protein [Ferruginibacter lapsinanis]UEG49738.1 DoxX family protein [Ferruginibacter lapsinanis]